MSGSTGVEAAKRAAARAAVADFVTRSGMRIGIGSGSTVVYAAERLGERARGAEGLQVTCVPTSFQARGVSEVRGCPFFC